MEKRALIAVVLSILIMVVWFGIIQPPERPTPPPPATATDETTDAASEGWGERADTEPAPVREPVVEEEAEPVAVEERVAGEAEETFRVTTRLVDVELTNTGAQALSWTLLEYRTPDGQPLALLPRFQEDHPDYLALRLEDEYLTRELNETLWRVARESLPSDGERGAGQRVRFTYADGRGLSATKELDFWENDYRVGLRIEVTDRGRGKRALVSLGPGFAAQENDAARSNYYYDGQVVVNHRGQVERLRRKRLDPTGAIGASVTWAGLEDQYFTALVVPDGVADLVQWRADELTPMAIPGAEADEPPESRVEPTLFVEVPVEGAQLYIGPKKYTLLTGLGDQMDRVVWFSSYGWLRPIVKGLFLALLWIHDNVAHNYGLAIVLATLVLRLLLFPVNQYSMVAMKKQQLQMQRLQPKIKAIKAKHKKKDAQTRAKVNQETMELYKKEGINPAGGLSGCLPLLAQFPILIGFYNMLTVAIELRGAPFFGWIQDLSVKDPYYITPILMGVTMFTQQKMAMSKIKDPQQLQQQRMMLFMPIMFTVICIQMPSGLVLYWFVNNLLGMGQQYLVNRQTAKLDGPQPKPKKAKA
jgi:YidC/Oxa1 family membrane protein insertase